MVENNPLVPQSPKPETCQAITDAGDVCGQNVTIPGIPYCVNHYKELDKGGDKSKKYSEHLPSMIKDKFIIQLKDSNQIDLTADIARIRAVALFLDEDMKHKIESYQLSGKELTSEEFSLYAGKLIQITESIRRLAESQARMFPSRVISIQRMKDLITKIMILIRKIVTDEGMKKEIVDGLKIIAIEMDQGSVEHSSGSNLPKELNP